MRRQPVFDLGLDVDVDLDLDLGIDLDLDLGIDLDLAELDPPHSLHCSHLLHHAE